MVRGGRLLLRSFPWPGVNCDRQQILRPALGLQLKLMLDSDVVLS